MSIIIGANNGAYPLFCPVDNLANWLLRGGQANQSMGLLTRLTAYLAVTERARHLRALRETMMRLRDTWNAR